MAQKVNGFDVQAAVHTVCEVAEQQAIKFYFHGFKFSFAEVEEFS